MNHAAAPPSPRPWLRQLRVIALAGLLVLLGLASATPALARTFMVTNLDDAGAGSLRQAISDANGDSSPPTVIGFAAGLDGPLDLTSGPLAITKSMTIDGPGASALELDGNGGQILTVSSAATVSISGLTFAFGAAPDPGDGAPATGGAIANAGTLDVSDSVFDDNAAGGASQLSGPDAGGGEGGAIFNSGRLTVVDSTFSDNVAGGAGTATDGSDDGVGGAIFNDSAASLTVTGSTFTGNTAGGDGGAGVDSGNGAGGAIAGNFLSSTTLTDDTLTGNMAGGARGVGAPSGQGLGGAVIVLVQSSVALRSDTIDGNAIGSAPDSAGAGILNFGTASILGTIVSGNKGGANCANNLGAGSPGSATVRESLEGPAGQTSCGFDLPSADPRLGVLDDNGGATQTQALRAGSPAIGAVASAADCPATDQRGARRPSGGCDVGAYEVAPPVIGLVSASTVGLTSATLGATVSNPDVFAGSVSFEYGTSTAYGTTRSSQPLPAGASGGFFTASLSGLAPGTVYHYRVVSSDPDGTTFGPDQQFTTATLTQATPTQPPSPPSQPSQASQPSNTFTFGKAKLGPGGAITLLVNAPDAGRFRAKATFTVIALKGRKRVKTTFTYGTASVRSTGRGRFKLVIGLRGLAARELKLLGSRQVTITVTFTPTGGTAAHKVSKVTVKRNRKGKYS